MQIYIKAESNLIWPVFDGKKTYSIVTGLFRGQLCEGYFGVRNESQLNKRFFVLRVWTRAVLQHYGQKSGDGISTALKSDCLLISEANASQHKRHDLLWFNK